MQYRILSPLFQGTWVNEVRLQSGVQWELSDGDTLTFGSQSAPGSSEFYFLFQKVRVRPLDFEAITIPKVSLVYFYSLTRFKSFFFLYYKSIFILFPRWVHFPQTFKTASEPIWIAKRPQIWTSLSCPSTGPPSSLTPLAAWVKWKVAAGPLGEAKATRVPSPILAYRLHLRWPRAFLGSLPPSLRRSSPRRLCNRRSAFSPYPGAGGSPLTQCSSRMTAQMSRIVNEVRPVGKTSFQEIPYTL